MSKADRMFEDIGLIRAHNWANGYTTTAGADRECIVIFHTKEDRSNFEENTVSIYDTRYPNNGSWFDVELHLAVHEKMKELGWLDAKD